MTASATIGHTARDIRRPITVDTDGGPRTVRRRPGRGTARRAAISESWGYR